MHSLKASHKSRPTVPVWAEDQRGLRLSPEDTPAMESLGLFSFWFLTWISQLSPPPTSLSFVTDISLSAVQLCVLSVLQGFKHLALCNIPPKRETNYPQSQGTDWHQVTEVKRPLLKQTPESKLDQRASLSLSDLCVGRNTTAQSDIIWEQWVCLLQRSQFNCTRSLVWKNESYGEKSWKGLGHVTVKKSTEPLPYSVSLLVQIHPQWSRPVAGK